MIGLVTATPMLREIDELYALDWDAFGEAEWERLGATYELLPGALSDHPGRWFSARDDEKHLSVSVEPPGLQVYGLCDAATFEAWHTAFESLTETLPRRAV